LAPLQVRAIAVAAGLDLTILKKKVKLGDDQSLFGQLEGRQLVKSRDLKCLERISNVANLEHHFSHCLLQLRKDRVFREEIPEVGFFFLKCHLSNFYISFSFHW
jgi:hypothetical protein